MKHICAVVFLALLTVIASDAQQAPASKWANWSEFVGTWQGAGGGQPGQGSGEFSFLPELQGGIMLRHNYATYPATKDKPAYRHDDLMVLYRDGASTHADYWDNEGHVIHYAVQLSADGRTAQFVSDAVAGQPRYRLTYTKTSRDELKLSFAIAPAGSPEQFQNYIEATARRVR